MTPEIAANLIDETELKAGINLGNILLVTGERPDGLPDGVSPDTASAIAEALGINIRLVPYASPGGVADALNAGEIDIGLIADEPKRAETITFAAPYIDIEATYLVAAHSDIQKIEDVDKPGVRVAVSERSAYDLFLTRHLEHAELVRGPGLPGALQVFKSESLDVLAGLRPALLDNLQELPDARVLDGRFSTVEQAVGTPPKNTALAAFIKAFLIEAKRDGRIQASIDRHGVTGKITVAARD